MPLLITPPDISIFLLAQTQPAPKPSSLPPAPQLQSNAEPSDPEKTSITQPLGKVPAQFPTQPVDQSNLILLVTPVVSSSLLMAMVLWVSLFKNSDKIEGLKEKGDFIAKSFPPVIEGITVYLIVAVIAVLSLSATIRPEGTLTIISGISGYVLGKQTSGGGRNQGGDSGVPVKSPGTDVPPPGG